MNITKLFAALLAGSMLLTACSGKHGGEKNSSSQGASDSRVKTDKDVKLKTYEFPEFLRDISDADVLSNTVYKSFDAAQLFIEPEKQPFEDIRCTACFADDYYIFIDGENYGLIYADGTVLIPPDGIKRISASASDLLQIRYDDASTAYYRVYPNYPEGGEFVTVDEFLPDRISFGKRPSSADPAQEVYVLQLDGADIYDTEFTSAEAVDITSLDTAKTYEAVYKAYAGKNVYYIAFDRLYNFTVFEGEYAFISLKIGGEYGESYLLSQDDYSELETLLSSFGRENSAAAPSKDVNEDYIQITMGLSGGDLCTYTISSDGYCLTDQRSADGGNKYFTVMDPETFVDLINWVDGTLSAEYTER